MDRYKNVRNVVIVLALAAAADLLPNGGRAASTFGAVLSIAFAAGLAYFAGRMYLEHRVTLYSLGDRHRGLLYGAVAVGIATIAAEPRMWQTGLGELAWFVILGLCVYTLLLVYRRARSL